MNFAANSSSEANIPPDLLDKALNQSRDSIFIGNLLRIAIDDRSGLLQVIQ